MIRHWLFGAVSCFLAFGIYAHPCTRGVFGLFLARLSLASLFFTPRSPSNAKSHWNSAIKRKNRTRLAVSSVALSLPNGAKEGLWVCTNTSRFVPFAILV